ncbi:hypothetical protein [Ralstonia soli]|uniref:Uncharacterized protein n=1 Tax=Ralstonia soli TaxID=2953896 RepID=A0ABT1AFB1_9RALS|nr:hypothetical protein [Ralstonia soli]MCO5396897.1 hypothetical protein [Ralstonia soli]
MADYVRKTILSQGYAHIKDISLTPEQKTDYEIALRGYQESRAKLMMSSSIVPEVKTKDGSLKVYATVYGALSDAIGDISGGFMIALNNLYDSSKMLADASIVEGLFLSKAPRRSLMRSESRTGVIKTTKDLFSMVANASHVISEEGEKKINAVLSKIERKAKFLNDQLTDQRDRVLVWENFLAEFGKLPKTPARLDAMADKSMLQAYQFRIDYLKKEIKGFAGSA